MAWAWLYPFGLRFPRRRPLDDDDGPLAQAHRPPAGPGAVALERRLPGVTLLTGSKSGPRAWPWSTVAGSRLSARAAAASCARGLAVRRPDLVEKVVTLGSPLRNQFDVHPGVMVQIGLLGTLGTLGVPRTLQPLLHLG